MPKLEKSPEYSLLFADGKLNVTMAVGYDEDASHKSEIKEIVSGLASRGYHRIDFSKATSDQLKRAGINPLTADKEVQHFVGSFKHDTTRIKVVLWLITPDTPSAKKKFARAMALHELVMYTGHGRYGSGPDFDDIHSAKGNFVIGKPYKKGKVTLGDNDLMKTTMTRRYQLLFFDGCDTNYYVDDLRSTPKTTKNLDIIGTKTELPWGTSAEDLLSLLDSVTKGESIKDILAHLQNNNQKGPSDTKTYFFADGFQDN